MRQRPYIAYEPPSQPLPARFQVGGLLGRGVGTEVYDAFDEELDCEVAVKLFPADLDATACRRIADEAQALDRLNHRRLVSVYDGGIHLGRPYLVMQLIRGTSLSKRLRQGPLLMAESVVIVALLADALSHVHAQGVVHRDVKPSNILLDEGGLPHLSDFGIALLAGQTRVTAVDEVIGTPAYLAPEQILGGALGPSVDIYALGLVLLECITGYREFDGPNKLEAALARLSRDPEVPDELPGPLAGLLRAMTAREPGRRPTALHCFNTLSGLVANAVEEAETVSLSMPWRPS
ncbi:serine/threonine-protein kinase [Kutzneria buriramensis]|uniref:non-specific serine/threonine protein kinase n=1 Tax=Kutzneria buriramensis TaxID=1045776 RepID=A0A3E0H5M8_9PSEU|nr:serine/threonine-protein kinase [Kutzneria buriramensis]REH38154.1 protein kinase-like protein [Kutzneria buriramensis]